MCEHNFAVWFIHCSEGSFRNILGNRNMTECVLWRKLSGHLRRVFLDTHTLHIHIYACKIELMSMLNHLETFLWFKKIVFKSNVLSQRLFKQITYKTSHLSRCPELLCIEFPFDTLFTLLVTFSLCKYRKMILYMLPALFPFHIYEIEKKLERKCWISEH